MPVQGTFLRRIKPHLYSCEGWWFCPEFLMIPDIMDGISLSIISWGSSRRQRSAAVAIQHFSSGGSHRPRPSPGTGHRARPGHRHRQVRCWHRERQENTSRG